MDELNDEGSVEALGKAIKDWEEKNEQASVDLFKSWEVRMIAKKAEEEAREKEEAEKLSRISRLNRSEYKPENYFKRTGRTEMKP